jgi:hypothetical protein
MTTSMIDEAASALATELETFFRAKTSCDIGATMAFFSPEMVTYIDATLGWCFDGYDALRGVFAQYMPNWAPPGRSYSTAILSNETSALIRMVDTPELFGGELRILAAVDFVDGKIVRWVDYWDAAPFDSELYNQFRTPAASFPTDLKDSAVPSQAAPELIAAAAGLQRAFTVADAAAAADLMHTDVVLDDMSMRTQVIGRIETTKYLDRVLRAVPYGRSSTLRHVVGGSRGGGFEWTAGTDHNMLVGITALELDPDGLITKVTSVYDSRQLTHAQKAAVIGAAITP